MEGTSAAINAAGLKRRKNKKDYTPLPYEEEYRALLEAMSTAVAAKEVASSRIAALANKLTKLWATEAGPFVRSFYALMDSFNLQRQAYHSGALVGNDVLRLLKPDAILAFTNLLMPRIACDLEADESGHVHVNLSNVAGIGDAPLARKFYNIFSTFSALANLTTRSEPLCEHELNFFDVLSDDFAEQFAHLFPEKEMLPKGHVLLYHCIQQARWFGSLGMLHEGVVEALHVVDNRLVLRFGNVKNPEQNIISRSHAHWQLADPGGPLSIREPDYQRERARRVRVNTNSRTLRIAAFEAAKQRDAMLDA